MGSHLHNQNQDHQKLSSYIYALLVAVAITMVYRRIAQ